MGTINGIFIYNSAPQNGATAKLWKITAFAAYVDSTETVLDDPLTATSVECNCSDGSVFTAGDVIKMGTECCLIYKISTDKLYIIRGWHGTTPAGHVATTAIYDETITPPEQDDSEPGSGQQGGDITTGVTYGGDGAYRFDAVPEMEYYASVYYSGHRSFIHHFVERDDPTMLQILTVAGDLLIRNADTIARLAKSTNGYVLTLVAGLPAWAAGGAAATREFWVPATVSSKGDIINWGDFPVARLSAANDWAAMSFKVPHDWTAITSAEIIVISRVTEAACNWDLDSDYGAEGEVYNGNSEADAAATYNTTNTRIFAVNAAIVLTGIAADDYVGLKITTKDILHDAEVIGLRFRYT